MNNKEDFFTHTIKALLLAPGASVSAILAVDNASSFEWVYSAYSCDVAGAAQTDSSRVVPLVDVTITPTDSSSKLMDNATPVPHIFGTGESPFVLPAPRLLQPQSTLQVQLENRSAAQTYNIYLSFIGLRKYNR